MKIMARWDDSGCVLKLPVKKDKDARDGASEGESKIDWVTEELASN